MYWESTLDIWDIFSSGVQCTGECHICYVDEHPTPTEKTTEKTTTKSSKRAKDAENTTEPMKDYEMMTNFNEKIHSGCHPIHTFMKGTSQGIELFQD